MMMMQSQSLSSLHRVFRCAAVVVTIVVLLAIVHIDAASPGPLSLPRRVIGTANRAEIEARVRAIAASAAMIQNENRTFTVGTQSFPFYVGPVPRPGSLAQQIQLQEASLLYQFRTNYPTIMATLVMRNARTLTTPDAVAALYDAASSVMERPMAMDASDLNFARQRLTIKPMRLRQVRPREYATTRFAVTNEQLAGLCGRGVTWRNIRALARLFVEDYSDAAQWNDPEAPHKYTPNVVGFFCFNDEHDTFVPLEIHYPDTQLQYTPFDTATNEWALAKMGLDAASVCFHQMFHMADTHAMTIPIRVELYRTMAEQHPIRALLVRHIQMDFGLEMLLAVVLLAPKTAMDNTFGWGATGSTRFLHDQLANHRVSIENDLLTDLARRGLDRIPRHPYATYTRALWGVIDTFIDRYVRVYYTSDVSIRQDDELQQWARACSDIPHLRGFPRSFKTRAALRKMLTHLVVQSAVKHHAMNGAATWHGAAIPYSPAALWKPMPTHRLAVGETIDLLQYTVPLAVMHEAVGISALFLRPVPREMTLPAVYNVTPFRDEPALTTAIEAFETSMQAIDVWIAGQEAHEPFPHELLRPSRLPYNTWV